MKPIIFLDIDGVLNGHRAMTNGYNTIDRECVARLNEIVRATGGEVVISSAWRYMILGGAMTVQGFCYLLRTYGFEGEVVGYTKSDEAIPERADQILDYVRTWEVMRWITLDDGSPDLKRLGDRWIKTNAETGIQPSDVVLATARLLARETATA